MKVAMSASGAAVPAVHNARTSVEHPQTGISTGNRRGHNSPELRVDGREHAGVQLELFVSNDGVRITGVENARDRELG